MDTYFTYWHMYLNIFIKICMYIHINIYIYYIYWFIFINLSLSLSLPPPQVNDLVKRGLSTLMIRSRPIITWQGPTCTWTFWFSTSFGHCFWLVPAKIWLGLSCIIKSSLVIWCIMCIAPYMTALHAGKCLNSLPDLPGHEIDFKRNVSLHLPNI